MHELPQAIQEQFDSLRRSYAARLQEKFAFAEEAWATLKTSWDAATFADLHRVIHGLAGSGATFGFPAVSTAARAMDNYLKLIQGSTTQPGAEERTLIEIFLAEVKLAINGSNTANGSQTPTLADRSANAGQRQPVSTAPPHNAAAIPPPAIDQLIAGSETPQITDLTTSNQLIVLVHSEAAQAQDLALQIGHFGYSVQTVAHFDQIGAAIGLTTPAAIVVDVTNTEEAQAMIAIRRSFTTAPAIIFLSDYSDLSARLHAVRAGGDAYLTKPININTLIDKLDLLTAHQLPDPYRILIIDDDPVLADLYALILKHAGMQTAVVTDPMHVMQPLIEFRPDLILMDVYMTGCSGLELAAVIRQQEAFVSIPIVFLSTESNLDQHLRALRLGGDDFLTKPIQADHLIASVTARAQRLRTLRSFMVRDSLTGLLNHTRTKEQLGIEILRARRQSNKLVFGMIDLDHFKHVNDTYGHAVGDRVLRGLARLLQQRLRRTDIIGRYGGEEFAFILPDTDSAGAVKAIDEIRAHFARIRQRADGIEFSVTFSCGLAGFPTYNDAASLTEAADRALYEAKRAGRDRVMLAPAPAPDAPFPPFERSDTQEVRPIPGPKPNPAQDITPVRRVLVVDDDEDLNRVLQMWLRSRGYRVESVTSGEAALARIERSVPPDLMFIDILMPGINGLQVLDLIRDQNLDMAIIMTSAFGSEQVAIDALRRGADDYLRKPFEAREFQVVLDRTLTRLQLNRQNAILQRQLEEKRRQLEAELMRAAAVQDELLPRTYPVVRGFELAARCLPAREVGGDFYDWQEPTPGILTVTLGDVMGKGMPAALLMATVRAILRGVAHQSQPGAAMTLVNRAIQSDLDRAGSYVTLFHARIDIATRRLFFVDAGHGHVLVRRANGASEALYPRGLPLGIMPDEEYQEGSLVLEPGDTLIMYSDGLMDARSDPSLDAPTLISRLESTTSAQDMVNQLVRLVGPMVPLADDLTIVVLRCKDSDPS